MLLKGSKNLIHFNIRDGREIPSYPHQQFSMSCPNLIKMLGNSGIEGGVSKTMDSLKCLKQALKCHIIFVQPVHKVVIIPNVSATAACLHPHSPLQAEQHSVNSLSASIQFLTSKRK